MIKGWEYLLKAAKDFEFDLTEAQLQKFATYLRLLQEWNQKINLTAIEDDQGIVIKHFIDSLLFLKKINLSSKMVVLDLGTGAGFPGLPLKIWQPEVKVVLADSLQKRIRFLEEVVKNLELKNIEIVHGRAEDLAREKSYREKFDCVVARAVASLPVLAEYCLPFVAKEGFFAAAKGPDLEEELVQAEQAIKTLGGEVLTVEYYLLPYLEEKRSLIKILKSSLTPKKYPRKAGLPAKRPLS
jgi:16S rRNA (guanine527-N7)-methyltransferase